MTCGMPDSKEFGDKGGGVVDLTMVAMELDGKEDDDATDGT